jgi:serine protease Do
MNGWERMMMEQRTVLVLLAGWVAAAWPAGGAEADVRRDAVVEAVERVMPAVVNVATEEVVAGRDSLDDLFREFFDPYYRRRQPNTQYSLGSGVIIDEEGFVLTNFHVVNRARRVWVKLADGRDYECDKISGTRQSDVALLRIRGLKDDKFAAVRFGPDDDLLLGETVLALGNPFGLGGSVSRGILSSKSRRPPAENEPMDVPDWLQTDAAINPGNSGGPLVNLRGELIGINVAVYREGQGIGFAIPVKRVAAAVAEIYAPELLEGLWFGARVRPGGLPLTVISVQAESPAAKAGLGAGDQIVELDGQAPRSYIHFMRVLMETKGERASRLTVQRGRQRQALSLRLLPETDYFNSDLVRERSGAEVQELTRDLARSLGSLEITGILVSRVERNSPAATAELERGMVIASIDGQGVDTVTAAAKILQARGSGARVKLGLVVPARRGAFLRVERGTVDLTLR